MLAGGDLSQQILVQGLVARQFGLRRLDTLVNDGLKILVRGQLHRELHHLAHAPAVELIFEIAVVEERLHMRVSGLESQLARTHRQIEYPQHANAQWRHALTTPVNAIGGEGLHEDHQVIAQV
jgi:hypothetical protein